MLFYKNLMRFSFSLGTSEEKLIKKEDVLEGRTISLFL